MDKKQEYRYLGIPTVYDQASGTHGVPSGRMDLTLFLKLIGSILKCVGWSGLSHLP